MSEPIPPSFNSARGGRGPSSTTCAMVGTAGCLAFVVIGLCLLTVSALPGLVAARRRANQQTCLDRLQQLGRAMALYVEDHDNHYPAAAAWSDALRAREPDPKTMVCPSLPKAPAGYAFNSALSGLGVGDVKEFGKAVALFDSSAGQWNAADRLASFSARHPDGISKAKVGNVLFADWHVESHRSAPPAEGGL